MLKKTQKHQCCLKDEESVKSFTQRIFFSRARTRYFRQARSESGNHYIVYFIFIYFFLSIKSSLCQVCNLRYGRSNFLCIFFFSVLDECILSKCLCLLANIFSNMKYIVTTLQSNFLLKYLLYFSENI